MAEVNSYAIYHGAIYPGINTVLNTAPTYGDAVNVLNGVYEAGSECILPNAVDVRAGTPVGEEVGTLIVPDPCDVTMGTPTDNTTGKYKETLENEVKLGTEFGCDGVEFIGTYTGDTGNPSDAEWIG